MPRGTASATMRALFPVTRAIVDDSEERDTKIREILALAGITTPHADRPIKWSKYSPQSPNPKQHAALVPDDIDVLLFGGAAGPGKSSWGLMGALQYCDQPNYAGLILRRSFAELNKAGALIDRAREWLAPTDAVWLGRDNKFKFPSGATLEFGFLARDADVHQYQSAEYQYIFFDELTAFTEFQMRYMLSRLRRLEGSDISLRVRAASNPGGPGHDWVRRVFPVDGSGPRIESTDGGDITFAFIPALLEDNQHVDRQAYERFLAGLDPYTRAQLRNGDWNVRPPGNWAYDRDHIDSAMEIGRRLDRQFELGLLRPAGEKQYIGCDFGELSAVLIGWPVEGGGWYIADEHIWGDEGNKSEPDVEAHAVIGKLDRLGAYPLDRMRFDAARPESQRLMSRTFVTERGAGYGLPSKISFAKYKRAAVRHTRALLFRSWMLHHTPSEEDTASGSFSGVLGISSRCSKLAANLYRMERHPEDQDQLIKKADDVNDALLALVAPDTKKQSRLTDGPSPDEVKTRLERVAAAAEHARKTMFGLSSG